MNCYALLKLNPKAAFHVWSIRYCGFSIICTSKLDVAAKCSAYWYDRNAVMHVFQPANHVNFTHQCTFHWFHVLNALLQNSPLEWYWFVD